MMKYIRLLAAFGAAFFIVSAQAQNAGTVTNHAFAVGKGAGTTGYTSLLCTSAQLAVGQSAADPICQTITGDVTISAGGVTAIGTAKVTYAMIQNVAGLSVVGRASNSSGVAADITAGTDGNVLRRSGAAIGFGSLDLTAAGTVGSSVLGVANGGTNCAIASGTCLDNITNFGSLGAITRTASGTYLARSLTAPAAGLTITNPAGTAGNPTFALANDLAALEALASTGIAVRTTTDTWAQRTLQAPAAGLTITNPAGVAGDPTFALANDLSALEGLSGTGIARRTGTDTWSVGTAVANSELATMNAYTFKGNNTGSAATPTDVDIAALTSKASPAAGDYVLLSDQAASGAWKKATVSSVASAGSVSSIAGNTGAFTLSHGLTNSTNDIQIDIATQRGYLAGLTLSTAGSSSTFSVAVGVSVDGAQTDFMKLTSAYSKTTSAWTVGSGNGALDTGSIANSTWYHVYEIKRPDTGVVDIAISTSASAPTTGGNIPAAYTLSRRIGSMKTNGSAQWTKFTQLGDEFLWDAIVADITATNPGTAAVTRTLTVPTGIQVWALINVQSDSQGITDGRAAITSLDKSDETAFNAGLYDGPGTGQYIIPQAMSVRTNTSAQIRSRNNGSGTSSVLYINTTGWIDRRGRDS